MLLILIPVTHMPQGCGWCPVCTMSRSMQHPVDHWPGQACVKLHSQRLAERKELTVLRNGHLAVTGKNYKHIY